MTCQIKGADKGVEVILYFLLLHFHHILQCVIFLVWFFLIG